MNDVQDFQKAFAASVIGASLFLGGSARAEINYDGVKYLGGGDKIDLNNANIRAYRSLSGFYPTLAGKIVTNGPYKTVGDLANVPGLTAAEKELVSKYSSKFVTLDPKPEYVLDKINNGLYR
jgi:photosystem II PsbU protein